MDNAVQSQKAVSAYFTSKQILPFGFAEENNAAVSPGHQGHSFLCARVTGCCARVTFPCSLHEIEIFVSVYAVKTHFKTYE